MAKDIHKSKFDDGTQVKLNLVKLYFRQWIPVFINSGWEEIFIYDFFAGEGQDSFGNYGSPLLFLEELTTYCDQIREKKKRVTVLFNDFDAKKVEILKHNVSLYLDFCRTKNKFSICSKCKEENVCPFKIDIRQEDFTDLFNKINQDSTRKNTPSFMFIDHMELST
jgi:three-Cys-motif partner protein